MKTIELTRGQVTKVSDEDYEELSKYKWCVSWMSDTQSFYAVRRNRITGGQILMSRAVMNALQGEMVDHKNHDTLDNQRDNLRICTRSENLYNQRPQVGRSSQFKGVYWNKRAHKWHTRIKLNGHTQHLGYFVSEYEAALTYDKKARELFGEFALTNFQTHFQIT